MKRRIDRLYTFTLDEVREALLDLLRKRDIPVPSDDAINFRDVEFHLAGDEAGIEAEKAAFMRWTENI
jgi:hypothetical protein